MKLQLKYKTDYEKNKIIEILSAKVTITKISKPYKSGKYYRIYLAVE